MPRINVKSKGSSGEREMCAWLINNLHVDAKRNLEQTRDGGIDIIIPPFGVEVKRCETLNLKDWWIQAKTACLNHPDDLMPVVAFRQNKSKWEFLISATNIGCDLGYIRISEKVFIEWAERFI
jgi:hypothetical protein